MPVHPADTLARYLRTEKLSKADFARLSGLSEAHVGRIIGRKRRAGRDAAHAIESATKGAVPASAWVTSRFPRAA